MEKKLEEDVIEEEIGEVTDESAFEDLTPEEREAFFSIVKAATGKSDKKINASKKQWDSLMREKHIVTDDGEVKTLRDSEKLIEDLNELNASMMSKRVLKGEIIGVRTSNPDSKVATQMAEILFGNGTFKVLIPSYCLFVYDIKKYRDPGTQKLISQKMTEMIGASVEFIVRQVDKGKLTVIADRLYALQEVGTNNYIRLNKNGRPRLIPGEHAEGKIIRVTKYSVVVSILGADYTIKKNAVEDNEISWNYIDDCRTKFKPGQDVIVKLLTVGRISHDVYDQNYKIIKATFSIKQATANPMNRWFDMINPDDTYAAEVQAVTDAGIFCEIKGRDGLSILCALPKYGDMPKPGDTKTVRVTDKKDETDDGKQKRIYGVFVGY